jgi:hypothetical protein
MLNSKIGVYSQKLRFGKILDYNLAYADFYNKSPKEILCMFKDQVEELTGEFFKFKLAFFD